MKLIMYKKNNPILLLILLLLFFYQLSAENKLGQTGLQYLEIGVSPRAEAMGGAFVIAGNNADAIFYNSAGIALVDKDFDVTFNRVQWFADIVYHAVGLTYMPKKGRYGVFGICFLNTDYGDFYGTRVTNDAEGYEDTGIFSPTAYAIGLSYGKRLTDKFSIGGQIKYTSQVLGSNIHYQDGPEIENRVSGFVFDFGLIYSTALDGFDFGMSIKNFASDFKYDEYAFEAPLTFRVGGALNIFKAFKIDNPNHSILLAVDAVHPRDYGEHLDLGIEYNIYNMFSLRGGYKVNYSEQSYTAGFGVNYSISGIDLRIDYAYNAFGIWADVHRWSIGLGL